jgi:hypothetical protein
MDTTHRGMEEDQTGDNMIKGRSGRNLHIRYTNAILTVDLSQLHTNELFDTMNNNDYRLFQCSHKFSYLAVDYQKQ